MAATESHNEEGDEYEVTVVGFDHVTVNAETRDEAMEKAYEQTDFGDLSTNSDEYDVNKLNDTEKSLYNVYKNGELVEEEKPMNDRKANKLDGHTQFNEEESDFERFSVEEVNNGD